MLMDSLAGFLVLGHIFKYEKNWELISAVTNICIKLWEDFYHKRIEKLVMVTQYSKCLDRHGDYVEK